MELLGLLMQRKKTTNIDILELITGGLAMSEYKQVSICNSCGNLRTEGDICLNCEQVSFTTDSLTFVKYAGAVKEVVSCWQMANCDDHKDLCQSITKEVALKIFNLKNRIEVLENAIGKHKNKTADGNDVDKELWDNL